MKTIETKDNNISFDVNADGRVVIKEDGSTDDFVREEALSERLFFLYGEIISGEYSRATVECGDIVATISRDGPAGAPEMIAVYFLRKDIPAELTVFLSNADHFNNFRDALERVTGVLGR